MQAVQAYAAALPPLEPYHPLAAGRADPVLFAGSWSVLLRPGGHHSPHTHTRGWLSSALHIALPETSEPQDEQAGWTAFGTPPSELGLDLQPTRTIRPAAGHVILFPSTTWHRTMPFGEGQRLSIAFDVR